jgi:hypothetical protein
MICKKIMPALLLTAGLIVGGCGKEEIETPVQSQPPAKTEQNHLSKSTYSDEQLLAMAGNVKQIDHISGNVYEVHFYGSTTVYEVDVRKFILNDIVELRIDDGTTTSISTIDVSNSEIDIQNDKVYKFASLNNDSIYAGSTALLKVTVGVGSHHTATPWKSASFVDNGSSDIFPENYVTANCFWCNDYETDHDIGAGLCITLNTPTFFWIEGNTYQCGDAYACGYGPDPEDEC